jgi:DNA-binding GntR family transcriptional regulator
MRRIWPIRAEECAAAPLYLNVARLIERNICDRRLAVGSLLPTEHELSSSLKVSRQTSAHWRGGGRRQLAGD